MSFSGILKDVKAKGVKLNLLKILVNPYPIIVEYTIRKKFNCGQTHSLLEEIIQFLGDLELNPELLDKSRLRNLRKKVCTFKEELCGYKC